MLRQSLSLAGVSMSSSGCLACKSQDPPASIPIALKSLAYALKLDFLHVHLEIQTQVLMRAHPQLLPVCPEVSSFFVT